MCTGVTCGDFYSLGIFPLLTLALNRDVRLSLIPAATVRRILALIPSEPTALLWVEANKLRLDVTKTNLLLTSRNQRAQELDKVKVKVNTQELVRCEKVKCLGVVLDDGLM